MEFFAALTNPDIPFLLYALIAGALSSLAFGTVGSFVVVRRISFIAGAISHCVLGGIGLALYLMKVKGCTWCHPMYGAIAVSLLAALIIGVVSLRARQREDTVTGALWAIGMALGLLFLARTPGYNDPMSYLFGNILLISKTDLWLIAGLDLIVLMAILLFYKRFLCVCFDEEFARAKGIRTGAYYLLLLCLIALTVVLMVTVVGVVMVIAFLTIPAAVAGIFCRRMSRMILLAIGLCLVFMFAGLGLSYSLDLPSGPMIIAIAGGVYLLSLLGRRLAGR